MKLSSNCDHFLIIGVSDGSNDYVHEYMFITTEEKNKNNKHSNDRRKDSNHTPRLPHSLGSRDGLVEIHVCKSKTNYKSNAI